MGGFENFESQSVEVTTGHERGGKPIFEHHDEQGFSIFRMDEVERTKELLQATELLQTLMAEVMLRGMGSGGSPWESGRCIDLKVTSDPAKRKGVRPSTAFDLEAKPRAKEGGATVGGTVTATLNGGSSLQPASGKVEVDAKYGYTGPEKKDETASIAFESRSKRGVGKATLEFDTKALRAYRMEGGAGDFHGVGEVCDLEQQFFVEGGGNTVRFEPSSSAGGTYSYSGNMSGFRVYGHGTYAVKYGRRRGEHHRAGSRLRRIARRTSHRRGYRGVPIDADAGRRLLVVRPCAGCPSTSGPADDCRQMRHLHYVRWLNVPPRSLSIARSISAVVARDGRHGSTPLRVALTALSISLHRCPCPANSEASRDPTGNKIFLEVSSMRNHWAACAFACALIAILPARLAAQTPAPTPAQAPTPADDELAKWGPYARLAGQSMKDVNPSGYRLHWRWETAGQVLLEEWYLGTAEPGKPSYVMTIRLGPQPGTFNLKSSVMMGKEWVGTLQDDGSVSYVGKGLLKMPYSIRIDEQGVLRTGRHKGPHVQVCRRSRAPQRRSL